jgi:chitinase
VQFYQGTTLLGSDTSSPYSFTWANVPAGSYSLTARATDNGGATTISLPVAITVGGGGGTGGACTGLLVYPAGLGSYQPGQLVVSNGQIYQVKPWPYSGWANQGGAYAPGTGWAWQDAWILVGPCS